jgi:hypothetical protein
MDICMSLKTRETKEAAAKRRKREAIMNQIPGSAAKLRLGA